MINALLLFLGFMFIVSFVWTYYLVSYKGTSAFTELSSTASNLFTGIVHLATAVTAWIRTNLNLICTWGPITILVFGSILIGLFFFGYAWTRNTQALATGTNDILTGPFHDFLVAFANTTETLKEGAEPAILLYDSWVGMARLFSSPAIEIAFDCTEFSWGTLLHNVVKILWSGYNSVIKFIAGIIYPDDTSGYFDFYTPLYEIGQSIASIKGILVCECRLLSFYFEYLSNLVSDPNLWHSIDRVLNFIIATVYQIIFSLIQFIQFFFALITGQWTAVWDYFFDNAYGYPDYFELSTIIRDAIVYFGRFYDHVLIEVINLVTEWIPFDVSSLVPELVGPILGNIIGMPIQILGETLQVRTRYLTVVAGNYGPKLHDDFDVLKIGYYEIFDAIANIFDIGEIPTLPEISCSMRHSFYVLVLILEAIVHSLINMYTVLVQSFWSFTIPVAFGDLILDARILAIVDSI